MKKEDIHKIVDIQLETLKNRLKARDISLEVSKEGKEYISERGYDPIYGARPLKRVVQKLIQDQVAIRMLKGDIQDKNKILVNKGKDGQ